MNRTIFLAVLCCLFCVARTGGEILSPTVQQINKHAKAGDAKELPRTFDQRALAVASINAELRFAWFITRPFDYRCRQRVHSELLRTVSQRL